MIIENKAIKLTIKQEKFCNKYIETGNASLSYRHAYNALKMKDITVTRASCELLKNYNVSTTIENLKKKNAEKSEITKDKILNEFVKIGFSSIAHLHKNWIERKDFDELTDEQKASIKSISTKIEKKNIGTGNEQNIVDVEYVKIELYDKLKALENINRMLGFDEPQKIETTISIADPFSQMRKNHGIN